MSKSCRKQSLPQKCFVWCCSNRTNLLSQHLSFFALTKSRAKSWLAALGRDSEENVSPSNLICSLHFKEEDIFQAGSVRKLRKGAVPTLFLGSTGKKVLR